MTPGHANIEPATIADAERLEAAYRRAIDGAEPELREFCRQFVQRRSEADLVQLALIARAQAPFLLNLVGSVIFGAVVWPHALPLLGIACFAVSSLICMRRAAR